MLLGRFIWILHELEVRDGAFEDLDVGINLLGDGFHDDHVGDESGELSIKFHVVLSDDVEHANQQVDSLNIEDASVIKYTEKLLELILVLLEFSLNDSVTVKVGQFVYHLSAIFTVSFHDGFDEVSEVEPVVFVEFDDHTNINQVNFDLVSTFPDCIPHLSFLIFA